jgi:hypothetical protein
VKDTVLHKLQQSFHRDFFDCLQQLGVLVTIWPQSREFPSQLASSSFFVTSLAATYCLAAAVIEQKRTTLMHKSIQMSKTVQDKEC